MLLANRRLPGCLADEDQLRVAARVLEDAGIDEPVVEDGIGPRQELACPECDEFRVTGARADEVGLTLCRAC